MLYFPTIISVLEVLAVTIPVLLTVAFIFFFLGEYANIIIFCI